MTKQFKLLVPAPPETIFFEMASRQRQDGFNGAGNTIKISELDSAEAEQYAEEIKQAFLSKWKESKQAS